MTAQQKDIGSGWGPTEPQSRRRYPAVGQLLCDYHQSLFLVEVDQAGAGDSRWSDPGTLLGVPSPPRGAARCWPSAGLLVGGQLTCRHVTPGKPGCGLPLRGHRGLGQSVCASVLLSRVLTEAGVTPAVHLRGPAPLATSPTHPVSESVKYLQNLLCPAGRGEQTPTPVKFALWWTHWGMLMHQQRASHWKAAGALDLP